MITINNLADIAALREKSQFPGALLDIVEERMKIVIRAFQEEASVEWTADEYGAFYLVEPGDGPGAFAAAGLSAENGGLVGAAWEMAYKHEAVGVFEVLVLFSNDGGSTFFIGDEPWLPAELAAKLAVEATPAPPTPSAKGDGERVPL